MTPGFRYISPDSLDQYAAIPISFWVTSIYNIEPTEGGLAGFRLVEQPILQPWLKDYDSDESPLDWQKKFDISKWGLFIGVDGVTPIAGAAVALNTPGVNMLEGRKDLAVLWDIRVHPDRRGQGIGRSIFLLAAEWARKQGCKQLKIETQNVNVPACKFYVKMGCELGMIHKYGYAAIPENAHEAMLFWYYPLKLN
jgi:GNAT superfamily N-acetyltransferase